MKDYKRIYPLTDEKIRETVSLIVEARKEDIQDFDNLINVFISGRKVGKIPTESLDITPSDRVGDISYDDQYFYIVINNAGSAEWRRIALGAW